MKLQRLFDPHYVWSRARVAARERLVPDAPWLTRDATLVLDQWLRPSDQGLEWGSGRSTIWFAARVGRMVSVEHDSNWADRVREMLVSRKLEAKVEYHVISEGADGGPSYPGVAAGIPDASLDFSLVDGMQRDACALAVIPKLRPGGILVVDNVNWYIPHDVGVRPPNSRTERDGAQTPDWATFRRLVQSWRCIWTTNGVTETALWQKPC